MVWLSLGLFDNLSVLLLLFHLVGEGDTLLLNHNLLLIRFVLIALVDVHASVSVTHVASLVLVVLLLFVVVIQIFFVLLVENLPIWLVLVVLLVHGLVIIVYLRRLLSLVWVVLLIGLGLSSVVLVVVVPLSLVVLALVSLIRVVDVTVNELLLLLEQLLLFVNLIDLGNQHVVKSTLVILTNDALIVDDTVQDLFAPFGLDPEVVYFMEASNDLLD